MGIVDDLRNKHVEVLQAIDGLSEEEMGRPNCIGKWAARDVLMHIAMWDGEALKALAIWRTGHEFTWPYLDGYLKLNDCWYEITKNLSATQVIQTYNLTRNALIADISCISDDIWEKRGGVPKWLPGIALEHNNWHLEKLREYRKSLGK
jgi:hypothetical protein